MDRGRRWEPQGLRSPYALAPQASAAAATAELLKRQEELNRKAEELDRRERELQNAALGGAAREWPVGQGRDGGHLPLRPPCTGTAALSFSLQRG